MGGLIELVPPPFHEIRLEDAIGEAISLGMVSMEQRYTNEWVTTISFLNRVGSHIFARGSDRTLTIAISKAINEARNLGAGGE